jgi:dihydroorotate dehydrogenase subfamily 1
MNPLISTSRDFWPPGKKPKSPFTIASGVITTLPSVLARVAADVPGIGFLTTKTISIDPRQGYREPVVHEYYPGCFINAVGLANPGASGFLRSMEKFLPLPGNKPLLVSIMGGSVDEFLQCAKILEPIADAFEINLSCPHVKGAGQAVGSDPNAVRLIVGELKASVSRPIIPKLSPNLSDIPGLARICESEGADGLCLINTVGPGVAYDEEGHPILSNILGGLSGSGILPIGLKAVREAHLAVKIPIIAAGGISSPEDVSAYRAAGASYFAVGSALAGHTTRELVHFFDNLDPDSACSGKPAPAKKICVSNTRTRYFRTVVKENVSCGPSLFRLTLEQGPPCLPGQFFFIRLPDFGEKPFSPAKDGQPCFLIRTVGPFTKALEGVKPGDYVYLRGPYGTGFPDPADHGMVMVAGGTGVAPLIMAAVRWPSLIHKAFLGFSFQISQQFRKELEDAIPHSRIVIDHPGTKGEVLDELEKDIERNPDFYNNVQFFLCGPKAMMDSAVSLVRKTLPMAPIFEAREDIMRCGIGLCGSCGTTDGLRSCVDGPVMKVNG